MKALAITIILLSVFTQVKAQSDTVYEKLGRSGIKSLGNGYGLAKTNDSAYNVDSSVIATRSRLANELVLKQNISDTAIMLLAYRNKINQNTDSITAHNLRIILLRDSVISHNTRLNTKQDIITLTTTGTSGPATLIGPTLNIPQYSGGGSSYTFSTGLTEASGTVTNNLSTGVSGGQTVTGGTASGNNLTLSSTSNATKGNINFGTSTYNEVNNNLGIGTSGAAQTAAGIEIKKVNPYVFLNTTTSKQAAVVYQQNGTGKWQFGMALNDNSTADFYIYDQANTKVRVYINTTGDTYLGGTANVTSTAVMGLLNSGKITVLGTNTATGTTGAQTINKPTGEVNFAAAATTIVVTNSLATTASNIFVQVYGTDATATSARVTKAAGSFTITLNAAATAETKVAFWVIN